MDAVQEVWDREEAMVALKTRIVLCDLDSTLSDTRHRDRSVLRDPETGEHSYTVETARLYGEQCLEDEVIEQTRVLIDLFGLAGYLIGFVSSRPESVLHLTKEWLRNHRIRYDYIRCQRDDEIALSSEAFKCKAVEEFRELGLEVVLMIDDWQPVRTGLLELGVETLVVQPPPELVEPSEETQISAVRGASA